MQPNIMNEKSEDMVKEDLIMLVGDWVSKFVRWQHVWVYFE